ncbi:Polyribonucleotide nucleotidyltransferase [Labeo rohita]|uniref:Polyribonucleotide nucleotidyltransferase n=1 Tax=Labeo rohita TaxID=84645 RepID=A0ABQ8L4S8_LABRO|nr:Polyribonucleotide nucleotidyltransferase [Labeo rohita]
MSVWHGLPFMAAKQEVTSEAAEGAATVSQWEMGSSRLLSFKKLMTTVAVVSYKYPEQAALTLEFIQKHNSRRNKYTGGGWAPWRLMQGRHRRKRRYASRADQGAMAEHTVWYAMAGQGARGAMPEHTVHYAMAGQGVQGAMAECTVQVTMVDPGAQEAMAEYTVQTAMAGQGVRKAMAEYTVRMAKEDQEGSHPPQNFSWGNLGYF